MLKHSIYWYYISSQVLFEFVAAIIVAGMCAGLHLLSRSWRDLQSDSSRDHMEPDATQQQQQQQEQPGTAADTGGGGGRGQSSRRHFARRQVLGRLSLSEYPFQAPNDTPRGLGCVMVLIGLNRCPRAESRKPERGTPLPAGRAASAPRCMRSNCSSRRSSRCNRCWCMTAHSTSHSRVTSHSVRYPAPAPCPLMYGGASLDGSSHLNI